MSNLSPYTVTIITKDHTQTGNNVLANAAIEIRDRLSTGASGGLSIIYEDQDGLIPITQTGATTNAIGQLSFFAASGEYNAVYNNNGTLTTIAINITETKDDIINDISQAYNFGTLSDAVVFEGLVANKVCELKEHTSGKGGGATWDVVARGTTTGVDLPNGIDIVASTGVPTLALVLRHTKSMDLRAFGIFGDSSTGETLALQHVLDRPLLHGSLNIVTDVKDILMEHAANNTGFILRSNTKITFINGGGLKLESGLQYSQIMVPASDASNITIEHMTADANNAFGNGLVSSGFGGGVNANVWYKYCTVKNLRSELITNTTGDLNTLVFGQREGGAAYLMELAGNGGLQNCAAINCQFGIRYAPESDVDCNYKVKGFYAEDCEAILNTTPSNFDNRDYAQDASTDKYMRSKFIMTGTTFRNCGASTDDRTALSFIWKDSTGDENGGVVGRASGNYYPWAGIRRSDSGTFSGLNWLPQTFNSGDTEWSEATTYNDGDRVKVTNNNRLGSLFGFGRVGGISINCVRGFNEHFSGAYPKIGALFGGIIRGVQISDVLVDVSCAYTFSFGTNPSTTWDMQPFMISQRVQAHDIYNIGNTTRCIRSNMPWNGTWASFGASLTKTVDFQKAVQFVDLRNIQAPIGSEFVDISLSTEAPSETTQFTEDTYLEVVNTTTSASRSGNFKAYQSSFELASITAPGDQRVTERVVMQRGGTENSKKESPSVGVVHEEISENNSIFKWTGLNNVSTATTWSFDVNQQRVLSSRDNFIDLGSPTFRMRTIYAGTGTISTSDERLKTEITTLDEAEKNVALELKGKLGKFKFLDAVEDKGDSARWHFGIGAQTVQSIFEKHGLNANNYGMFCYDQWDDIYDTTKDQVDKFLLAKAGKRYGVRYSELLAFIVAAI